MSDLARIDYGHLAKVAEMLAGSTYCTERKPQDALWIIATGASLGLDPVTALRGIHVVKGKPVLSADLMAAAALRHPDCVRFQVVEMGDASATVEVMRKGWEKPSTYSFTKDDAQRAGLWGRGSWKAYAPDMLKARAISRAARAAFPDALLGVYVEGELDAAGDTTPEPQPPRERLVRHEEPPEDVEVIDMQDVSLGHQLGRLASILAGVEKEIGVVLNVNEYVSALVDHWGLMSKAELDARKIGKMCDAMSTAPPEQIAEKVQAMIGGTA